jgi:GH18 family chitinase
LDIGDVSKLLRASSYTDSAVNTDMKKVTGFNTVDLKMLYPGEHDDPTKLREMMARHTTLIDVLNTPLDQIVSPDLNAFDKD